MQVTKRAKNESETFIFQVAVVFINDTSRIVVIFIVIAGSQLSPLVRVTIVVATAHNCLCTERQYGNIPNTLMASTKYGSSSATDLTP